MDASKQFKFRLPNDVKTFIEAQAARNGSTQGSEIVRCIRDRMDRMEGMATTGSKFGDRSPVEAGNSSNQEKADAVRI